MRVARTGCLPPSPSSLSPFLPNYSLNNRHFMRVSHLSWQRYSLCCLPLHPRSPTRCFFAGGPTPSTEHFFSLTELSCNTYRLAGCSWTHSAQPAVNNGQTRVVKVCKTSGPLRDKQLTCQHSFQPTKLTERKEFDRYSSVYYSYHRGLYCTCVVKLEGVMGSVGRPKFSSAEEVGMSASPVVFPDTLAKVVVTFTNPLHRNQGRVCGSERVDYREGSSYRRRQGPIKGTSILLLSYLVRASTCWELHPKYFVNRLLNN